MKEIKVMQLNEFSNLEYKDQLQLVNRSGKLCKTLNISGYLFSLYEVHGFYVELKRKYDELYFDRLIAMNFEDIPIVYK
jgi:hypothetical protein